MNRRIVIGTWSMSGDWGPIDLNEIIDVLEKAYYEYGFEEFDTAPNYGNGFSEFLLGKIFYNEKNILISAHGNSIRALCKKLFNISDTNISKLEIPTGNPLFIKFNENLKIDDGYYLDSSRSRDLLVKF